MKQWWRRVRGVIGMGLAWAVGGAGAGAVIELLDNVPPGGLAELAAGADGTGAALTAGWSPRTRDGAGAVTPRRAVGAEPGGR